MEKIQTLYKIISQNKMFLLPTYPIFFQHVIGNRLFFLFGLMNRQDPVYLVNMFAQTNSLYDHNTSGGTNISVKNITCLSGQRRFAYRGTKVWDNIQEIIKIMQPLHVRKDIHV